MKVYRTDEIRNVVLLGHGGSGKTSLAEAMLYVSGATNRMGKISESNTVSDFDKEEQKRGFSISTSLVQESDSTMRHGIQALEEAVIRRMVLMDVSICH